FARGAVCRGGERPVSAAASPAVGNSYAFSGAAQVAENIAPVAVPNKRTGRNANDEIVAITAVTVVPSATTALLVTTVLAVSHVRQVFRSASCFHTDTTAVAAVATVRAATWNIFLTAEAAASCSPVSSFDINHDAVDKHKARLPSTGLPALNAGSIIR